MKREKMRRSVEVRTPRGYTLIELLTVLTIASVALAMAAPPFLRWSVSLGKDGAVNAILSAVDLARVTALQYGVDCYIGFADNDVSDGDSTMAFRSFIAFRQRMDEDRDQRAFIPLTRWITLPRGIFFKDEPYSVIGGHAIDIPSGCLPRLKSGARLPVIEFNSMGAIRQPAGRFLYLYIYECGGGGKEAHGFFYDRISFSRFTGRAYLDITRLQ
jgi:prepilin-type N-terminal cleavage/methylation domain-containing protein